MRVFAAAAGGLLILLAAGPVLAKAPQPVRPVAPSLYSGRWYQLARIFKINQYPCPGATDDFAPDGRGGIIAVATCQEASAPGRTHQFKAKVSIVPGSRAAKFKMSFFGGLITQEYWVLDHADDQSWALMATPGGNYLWLIARRPKLDPAARAAAVARIAALGYDTSRLTPTR
ncbi:MAG TPA: lipocalin family protein [Caulobacteraceae bacterium]|jgi:apolipoprotein D and lipocalin family protein